MWLLADATSSTDAAGALLTYGPLGIFVLVTMAAIVKLYRDNSDLSRQLRELAERALPLLSKAADIIDKNTEALTRATDQAERSERELQRRGP